MHIERIYIEDNFVPDVVTDQFRRMKFGVGIFLKEGETADTAIKEAEQLIKEYIQKNTIYPHNHIEERIIDYGPYGSPYPSTTEPLPVIQTSNSQPELREQTLEEQIRSCTDINVLKAYQLLVKKDPILQKAYDDTMSTIKFKEL